MILHLVIMSHRYLGGLEKMIREVESGLVSVFLKKSLADIPFSGQILYSHIVAT